MFLEALSLLGQGQRTSRDRRLRTTIEANFDFVWRTLRRLGVPASDVDDAVQQVLLVFNQKLDTVETGKERRFLFATAVNTANNMRRGIRRRREDGEGGANLDSYVEEGAANPEDLADRSQRRALLGRALDAMTEDRRIVFVLFELEQMTCPEIAALLDVPVGTVASRLHRARDDFRGILERLHPASQQREGL